MLHLYPGEGNDTIKCNLFHALTTEGVSYEALSYSQGDTGDLYEEPILVDGHLFRVTRNLHAVFRCLRHEKDPKILWIDAICINQKDTPERNAQVLLMREIYSGGAQIIIWLGDAREDSDKAMCFLDRAAAEGLCARPNSLCYGKKGHEDTADVVDPATIQALELLMGRPWFTRIWVVQEFLLGPPSTRIVVCGRFSMPWPKFEDAFRRTSPYVWRRATLPRLLGTDGFIAMMKFRESHTNNNLNSLLERYRHYNATNDRDKVYGLLGLLTKKERNKVNPNYDKSEREVYTGIARLCIETTGSLRILSSCRFAPRNQWADLPTWVPDWRFRPFSWIEQSEYARLVDVIQPSRVVETPMLDLSTNDKLITQGVSLGTITKVWDIAPYSQSYLNQFWHSAISYTVSDGESATDGDMESLVDICINLQSSNKHDARQSAIRECLINHALRHRRSTADFGMVAYAALAEGRRYFKTSSDEFGLASKVAHVGNTLFYLPGAPLPMILQESKGEYRVMCDAYVDLKPEEGEGEDIGVYTTALYREFGRRPIERITLC